MKFGLFYQIQVPKPWNEDSEAKRIWEALDQIVYAEEMGYDSVWFSEHFHHGPSGTALAFENRVGGVPRTFLEHDVDENGFPTYRDTTDGSIWNIEGIAIEGAQLGKRLARMPAVQVYWFVWATFFPGSPINLL